VKALLNQIAGKHYSGAPAQVPAVFWMNFQSAYVGQSVLEPSVAAGGYQNAAALPSAQLLNEIEFVDTSIGDMVNALKQAGIYNRRFTHRSDSLCGGRHEHAGNSAGRCHPLFGVTFEPDPDRRDRR
jgi:hypothetical protein